MMQVVRQTQTENRQITDKSIIPFLKENRDKNRLAKVKSIFDNSTELKNKFLKVFFRKYFWQILYSQKKNNKINVDLLYKEMKVQAAKSAIIFDIPTIGPLVINESDLDKIYSIITR